MPASTRGTRGLSPSVLDLLDVPGGRTSACPGCGEFAPGWTRVDVEGLSVLTHDGDVICPRDRHFGYRPAAVPVSRPDNADACPSCIGTLVDLDEDGSLTGFVGALVPCHCTNSSQGQSPLCACHVEDYPLDGGFTGWIADPSFDDDKPFFRPCPVHTPARTKTVAELVGAA